MHAGGVEGAPRCTSRSTMCQMCWRAWDRVVSPVLRFDELVLKKQQKNDSAGRVVLKELPVRTILERSMLRLPAGCGEGQ